MIRRMCLLLVLGACGSQEQAVVVVDGKTITTASPAGTVFSDCAECPQMVVVPAGRFKLGWDKTPDLSGKDTAQLENSKTVLRRAVTFHQPFAVGRFEVTREQFSAFLRATRRAMGPCPGPSFQQGDNYPVVCVSYADAQAYVSWLNSVVPGHGSQRPGSRGRYRLLSEAEWEYSARTRTDTPPAKIGYDQANLGEAKQGDPWTEGRDNWRYTSPVGSFPANAFGLFDMNGNVTEMVEDCIVPNGYPWADTLDHLPEDGTSVTEADCLKMVSANTLRDVRADGSLRELPRMQWVMRGSSWGSNAEESSWDFRYWGDADSNWPSVGFRVAKTI